MFKDTPEGTIHYFGDGCNPLDMPTPPSTQTFELKYCTVCLQMTNHLDDVCQRCYKRFTTPDVRSSCCIRCTPSIPDNPTCKNISCSCHKMICSTPPKIEEWAMRFDEKVNELKNDVPDVGMESKVYDFGYKMCLLKEGEKVPYMFTVTDWENVKSFIQDVVTQTRLSTIEEAKGCVPSELECMNGTYTAIEYPMGFNSARSQMLENLNKMK